MSARLGFPHGAGMGRHCGDEGSQGLCCLGAWKAKHRAPCLSPYLSLACEETALQCPPQHIQNGLHAVEGKVSPRGEGHPLGVKSIHDDAGAP